jgi:hypothetical protein
MIPLSQKIQQLKDRYASELSLPPTEALAVCEALRELVEAQALRLTAMGEAQIRLDGRIHALERLASTYQEPRG